MLHVPRKQGLALLDTQSRVAFRRYAFALKNKKLNSAAFILTSQFGTETNESFQKHSSTHVVLSISIKA